MSVSDSVLFEGEEGSVSGSAPVAQDMEISAGTALTIPAGNSLTILDDVPLTNNGTLTINGTLVNDGILTGSGSIIYKVIGGSLNKTGTSLYVGDELTLTVTPQRGVWVEEVSVTDRSREVDVIGRNATYTFEQLRGRVTIAVTFREIAPSLPFDDVPVDFWAADEIAWTYKNSYISSVTVNRFTPNSPISRQQVWMILARISGADPTDMAAARQWAIDSGISDGTAQGTLNPQGTATRAQFAVMLYRFHA